MSLQENRPNINNLKKIEDASDMKIFSKCNTENVSKNLSKYFSEFTFAPATKYVWGDMREISDKFIDIKISESDEKESDDSEKIEHEGYIFKITNSNNLKKVWFKLVHKDLYCKTLLFMTIYFINEFVDYKSCSETAHMGMDNLSGAFIKEESVVILTYIKLWCFSKIYPNKARYYYIDKEL